MPTGDSQPETTGASEAKVEEPDMEAFRAEIKQIFTEGNVTVDMNINFNDLVREDAIIWYRIKNHGQKPLTHGDFYAYVAEVKKLPIRARERFAAFIANKFTTLMGNEELERRKTARPM